VQNFVQFIVSMDWIRFHCTEVEHARKGSLENRIAQLPGAPGLIADRRLRPKKIFEKRNSAGSSSPKPFLRRFFSRGEAEDRAQSE
jgi:hypothetical protein